MCTRTRWGKMACRCAKSISLDSVNRYLCALQVGVTSSLSLASGCENPLITLCFGKEPSILATACSSDTMQSLWLLSRHLLCPLGNHGVTVALGSSRLSWLSRPREGCYLHTLSGCHSCHVPVHTASGSFRPCLGSRMFTARGGCALCQPALV